MRTRTLGPSLVVSEQGLGCMGMSGNYGVPDEAGSRATLRRALELGVTFFDTADIYGPYANEELLGSELGSVRSEVVIATKFGHEITPEGKIRINGRPEYVRAACDASLRRLGTDYIDLYYQHRVDLEVPVEETWGAMKELVDAGKVRALGISEAAHLTRFVERTPCTRSPRSRASTHCGLATSNETAFSILPANSTSVSCPSHR
jgi:aryl-alcohol dehydrogenase-like predicted oxidoreductase